MAGLVLFRVIVIAATVLGAMAAQQVINTDLRVAGRVRRSGRGVVFDRSQLLPQSRSPTRNVHTADSKYSCTHQYSITSTACGSTACSAGTSCCDEVCIDISSSSRNCGSCNNRCAYHRECCGGVCVDSHVSDPLNCGKCGNACSDGVPCLYGMCGYNSSG